MLTVPGCDKPCQRRAVKRSFLGWPCELKPNKPVSIAWVTGPEGTQGAETVVTVELFPSGEGTRLRLTHAGFPNEKARKQHEDAWPTALKHLDEALTPRAR